jgi:hypothetical protein
MKDDDERLVVTREDIKNVLSSDPDDQWLGTMIFEYADATFVIVTDEDGNMSGKCIPDFVMERWVRAATDYLNEYESQLEEAIIDNEPEGVREV